jgi:hypothetical protein
MSNSNNKRTRWSVIIFGFSMAAIMVLSVMSGYLMQLAQRLDVQRQQREALQPTPTPTLEPPPSVDSVTFERDVLQGNGLFSLTIPEPPNWGAVESAFDSATNQAKLLLRDELSVIEASMTVPTQPIATVDDLNASFTEQTLGASWRNYSSWRETQRVTVERNGREYLQIDFELGFRDRMFVARQAAWTDGTHVFSVRVITPENATDLLVYLLENVADQLTVYEQFSDTPVSWTAYYDAALNHVIRSPASWQVTDAADGFPASIEGENTVLRVEGIEGENVDDEAAAEAYVVGLPNVTEVLSVTEAERGELTGYAVAYRYALVTGETGSGQVLLLNGADTLHVANLRVAGVEADLNAPAEDDAGAGEYAMVMQTFSPLEGLEYAPLAFGSAAPLQAPQTQPGFPQGFGGF